ncbi:molybdopterin biosynthesis protein [Candidatus Bathyarchaeota archaeon]|nr:molybdopterin biosynthesis protein [Candidatus Bathyarchaeota archaeon]
MTRKIFRDLVSVEEAKKRFRAHFIPRPVGVEKVLLERCYGRVLAQDIEAQVDVPPFDRATMDGFAVHAEDTFEAEEDKPRILKTVGKVSAGEKPSKDIKKGEAVEISTGAPIPKGANAVVMVEYTQQEGDHLKVYKPVAPGENIMAAGSDIMAGELILRKGTVLTPRETGVLAALGTTKVECFKVPKVAILSTGDEIVEPGSRLEYGKVYDINARSISDAVVECGGEPVFLGIVEDDPDALRLSVDEGLRKGELLVTSGGTSAGAGDLLHQIINNLGAPGIIVHGVSVKPGKPTILAVIDGKPLFGLPGYPTSALTIFEIFVSPILREMAGRGADVEKKTIDARTAGKIYPAGGRHEYMPVNIIRTGRGEYTVYPVPGGSGAITTLEEADGFIEIPENKLFLEEGERVQVRLFSSELKPADLMIIGSHCIGIDLLLELIRRRHPDFNSKVINVGSSGGLAAIRRGEADIAGVHLLDEETGEYNTPFLDRYGIADRAVLIRGYNRKQGLIVARKNPKEIKGLEDILREDLSFVNRNPGSGTRILLDMKLNEIARSEGIGFEQLSSKIKGYRIEAKSHTAVAVAVLQGKADLGLGIETVADRYGLDFIPVTEEHYDFTVQTERLGKESIQVFLGTLRSEDFRDELEQRVPGLLPTTETGKTIYPP